MNSYRIGYLLLPIFLATSCGSGSTLRIRKNPTADFQLKDKKSVVAILSSRNFSDHKEIDLRRLDGKLLTLLRAKFKKGRFISIRQMKENLLSGQDKEIVEKFIASFNRSGMFRAKEIKNANSILKVDYFLAPSFGATIGAGFSAEWIFTLSVQIYDAKTGKMAFDITAENSEESTEGFELGESDFFESVLNDVVDAIP